MEINFDPKAQSDLKLVGPNAGWQYRKARDARYAKKPASQAEGQPEAPAQEAPEPPVTK